MNYEEMSDFEINKRVAFSISKTDFETNDCEVVRYFCDGQHLDEPEVFDPCNNPADAWPVILLLAEMGTLCFGEDYCTLIPKPLSYVQGIRCSNKLRAAMICYLMMQEAK